MTARTERTRDLHHDDEGSLARIMTPISSLNRCMLRCHWWASVTIWPLTKRFMDITISVTLLVTLCPVFLLVGLLIWATDRGPILFWQTRVGRWGEHFRCPKFRSMVTNAEHLKQRLTCDNDHGNSITFKIRRDPRVTGIGRIIRKTSVDELPQLWCVLCGTMSLVGPRPPIPVEVSRYTIPDRRRLDVKPGLTCIWQVSGRGDVPFPQQVIQDVYYIEHRTVGLDLRLLIRTIPAVLFGKGAY